MQHCHEPVRRAFIEVASVLICPNQAFFDTRRCRSRYDSRGQAEGLCYIDSPVGGMHGWTNNDLSDVIAAWRTRPACLGLTLGKLVVWGEAIAMMCIAI